MDVVCVGSADDLEVGVCASLVETVRLLVATDDAPLAIAYSEIVNANMSLDTWS